MKKHSTLEHDNIPFNPVTTPLSLGEGHGGEAALYIFDFDGTLGDSKHLIVKTMQDTCRSLVMPIPTENACTATIGLPLEKCFAVACHIDDATAKHCAAVYHDIFQRNNRPGSVPPFPGVIDTLRTLHEHGRLIALASSRCHESLQGFAEEYGITGWLCALVGADDVTHAKPDAEPVNVILQATGCKPEDTLVIGDTRFDILMGRNAGAHTCGVTYGNGSCEELLEAGAEQIIESFGSLTTLPISPRGEASPPCPSPRGEGSDYRQVMNVHGGVSDESGRKVKGVY